MVGPCCLAWVGSVNVHDGESLLSLDQSHYRGVKLLPVEVIQPVASIDYRPFGLWKSEIDS